MGRLLVPNLAVFMSEAVGARFRCAASQGRSMAAQISDLGNGKAAPCGNRPILKAPPRPSWFLFVADLCHIRKPI
jgi:hypothetical protein